MHETQNHSELFPLSLNSVLSPNDISMDLTMAGLLVERAEKMSKLYSEYLDWDKTEEVWHESRIGNRGSRASSQKIFRVLKSRFQSSGPELPVIEYLPAFLEICVNHRSKAQILYFYLLEGDRLFKYVINEYVRNIFFKENHEFSFGSELDRVLERFRFSDGTPLEYAESTINRWCRGFRSVMREIGVLNSSSTIAGTPPPIGDGPLLISGAYSWKMTDNNWLNSPFGWMCLFQPREQWNTLANRLAEFDNWSVRESLGEIHIVPSNNPFQISQNGVL